MSDEKQEKRVDEEWKKEVIEVAENVNNCTCMQLDED